MASLKVVVEGDEVQTQLLGDDMHGGTTSQSRIQVHHTGIETVAGVGSHVVHWLQAVEALIPMAECHQVAMCQLAPLRYARRARGVEKDEKVLGLETYTPQLLNSTSPQLLIFTIPQPHQVLRQQHISLILINDGAKLLISNQQLRIGILHHEVQALLRIAGIKRLVGAASLQHAK